MLLVGRLTSPFSRRVAVSLRYLGFDFEHRAINAWSSLAEMRSYNPAGRVPALVLDDGEVLFDSNAILDYLDFLVGPDRAPDSPRGARPTQRHAHYCRGHGGTGENGSLNL